MTSHMPQMLDTTCVAQCPWPCAQSSVICLVIKTVVNRKLVLKIFLSTGTLSPLRRADSPTDCAGFLAAYVGTTRKLLFSLEQHVTKCETTVLQYAHFFLISPSVCCC